MKFHPTAVSGLIGSPGERNLHQRFHCIPGSLDSLIAETDKGAEEEERKKITDAEIKQPRTRARCTSRHESNDRTQTSDLLLRPHGSERSHNHRCAPPPLSTGNTPPHCCRRRCQLHYTSSFLSCFHSEKINIRILFEKEKQNQDIES